MGKFGRPSTKVLVWRVATCCNCGRCPYRNPTLVTTSESADYRCDEGLVQLDLVRSGRPGPVTGGAASRNPGPATPAQCVAAQIAQANGTRQYRPCDASRPLSPGTQGALEALKIITPENGDPLSIALVFVPSEAQAV